MDADNLALAAGLVSEAYVRQGGQALAARHRQVKALLSNRQLPERGWDEASIQAFIQDCALMDSNMFLSNVGVGEREGRVACPLVARRYQGLAHGIGRSGDIAAEQPKAAGSSLLAKLAMLLAGHALRVAGLQDLGAVTVLPLATGMAITVTLTAIRAARPAGAHWVVWSRIDQKTCLKAITAAGCKPFVVELKQVGDELQTDVAAMHAAVATLGADSIVACVTTTSCFAPRAADDVVAVAKLCAAAGVPHLINNAYGVQSSTLCKLVTSAWRKGRVDAVVQSTDKNFMVPVGGALVCEGVKGYGVVGAVNTGYPGRAAINTHLDLLMTLLHWGLPGWKQVLADREALFVYLQSSLGATARQLGTRLLSTPGNPISLALTLTPMAVGPTCPGAPAAAGAGSSDSTARVSASQDHASHPEQQQAPEQAVEQKQPVPELANPLEQPPRQQPVQQAGGRRAKELEASPQAGPMPLALQHAGLPPAPAVLAVGGVAGLPEPAHPTPQPRPDAGSSTMLGSMLWARCVSGTRVAGTGKAQTVAGVAFANYGAHSADYPHVYLTAAAAVGGTTHEVDEFCGRLLRVWREAAAAKGRK